MGGPSGAALSLEGMMNTQTILPVFQTILSFMNICVLGYALLRFLNRPHSNLEAKVNGLDVRLKEIEVKLKEIDQSLHLGNDRFREQEETNEVLIRSVFALLEFEVHYCETEQKPITKNLEKAKDDLHDFLAKK
jgi:hypothetical protein